MKEIIKYGVEKTNPDIVIIDSLSQFINFSQPPEKLKDLKLAFLTVAAFGEYGKQMLKELDISDYILKPYDIDDLLRRISKMLET